MSNDTKIHCLRIYAWRDPDIQMHILSHLLIS